MVMVLLDQAVTVEPVVVAGTVAVPLVLLQVAVILKAAAAAQVGYIQKVISIHGNQETLLMQQNGY